MCFDALERDIHHLSPHPGGVPLRFKSLHRTGSACHRVSHGRDKLRSSEIRPITHPRRLKKKDRAATIEVGLVLRMATIVLAATRGAIRSMTYPRSLDSR